MITWLHRIWTSFAPTNQTPAASVQADHYLGLDLLRGVAAIGVVWFHCDSHLDIRGLFWHGYLAVDFFFVLSGFVMARAYLDRIASKRLSILRFVLLRAIRLMPLIVLGTIVAAVIEIGRPGIADQHRHFIDAAQALVQGVFLIPTLHVTTLEMSIFPLNSSTWSLFLEAIANLVFAVWARSRIGLLALTPLLVLSVICLSWGLYHYGHIGFGAVPALFWLGFARVAWSFVAGIFLFRFRDYAPRVPFVVPFVVLIAALITPPLGSINEFFDGLSVFIILPLIILAASSARFGSSGRRWSAVSGDLSYPMYALHFPFIRLLGVVGTKFHLSLIERIGLVMIATTVIIVIAAAAYALYDMPIRRWLILKLAPVPTRQSGAEIVAGNL